MMDSHPPSPVSFPVLSSKAQVIRSDAGVVLLWAKYDSTVRDYLRFWLDAIEADR